MTAPFLVSFYLWSLTADKMCSNCWPGAGARQLIQWDQSCGLDFTAMPAWAVYPAHCATGGW